MRDEHRGMYAKPQPAVAAKRTGGGEVLSVEALAVAHEYIDYRVSQGQDAAQIMRDLGLCFQPGLETLQTVTRLVAVLWQDEIAPLSRAVDARERAAVRERRKVAYGQKTRVLRGRAVRDPIRPTA